MKVELIIPEAVEPVIKGISEATKMSYSEAALFMIMDYCRYVLKMKGVDVNEKSND